MAVESTIRLATSADIPFVRTCLIDSWVHHAKQVPSLLNEERMRQSKIEAYYEKALASANSVVLIAEMDGEPIGMARADVQLLPDFFIESKILFIDDIYVVPEQRRKGVATQLFAVLEEEARKRGIYRIQARVYTFNSPTQHLLKERNYKNPYAIWDKVLT